MESEMEAEIRFQLQGVNMIYDYDSCTVSAVTVQMSMPKLSKYENKFLAISDCITLYYYSLFQYYVPSVVTVSGLSL
jgi:hypothetical protein